jgi:hypothetical protein
VAGLRENVEACETVDFGAAHFVQHRLIKIELRAGRCESIVAADGDDHFAAAADKSREVRIR